MTVQNDDSSIFGKTIAGKYLVMQAIAADERSFKLVTLVDLREQSRVLHHRQALQTKRLLVIDYLGCDAVCGLDVFRTPIFEVINLRWRSAKNVEVSI